MLAQAEYQWTADRQREIAAGVVQLPRDFGPDHVAAIHAHLFQDVYEWAGQFREVEMIKAGSQGFGFQPPHMIEDGLLDVQAIVQSFDWKQLDRGEFLEAASTVFAGLNQVHPFREGNGRSSKVFMQHVAEQSQFRLDFSGVDPHLWNLSSELSRPAFARPYLEPAFLVPSFDQATVAAPPTSPSRVQGAAQGVNSVLAASYPQPAQGAVQPQDHPRFRGEHPSFSGV